MKATYGAVEHHKAPPFLAKARWRCHLCASPWYAAESWERAWQRLSQHRKECR